MLVCYDGRMITLLDNKIRNTIVDIVSSIESFDEIEEAHKNDVLQWISSGAQIFRVAKPDIPNKHLVSYFVVLDHLCEKILLVDHKKAGLWVPAGGHVEVNEDPKETVRREVQEELGIEAEFLFEDPLFISITKTVGLTAGHMDVSLWYILKGDSCSQLDFDQKEFHGIRWFNYHEIPYDRSDPHLQRFIEKLMSSL